jgi:hypothetical protein
MIFPNANSSLDGWGPIVLFRLMSLHLNLSRQNGFGGAPEGVLAARTGLQTMGLWHCNSGRIHTSSGPWIPAESPSSS